MMHLLSLVAALASAPPETETYELRVYVKGMS